VKYNFYLWEKEWWHVTADGCELRSGTLALRVGACMQLIPMNMRG